MPQTRATLTSRRIAASNFSSDQGSVDSCHYSNGSDSNSSSSPCSPEDSDRCSRASTPQPMPLIPPSLQDEDPVQEPFSERQISLDSKKCTYDDTRTNVCGESERKRVQEQTDSNQTKSKNESIKHFYLQTSHSVPNSFQRTKSHNCVSKCEYSSENLCYVLTDKISLCGESSSHSEMRAKRTCIQANTSTSSLSQANCSSNELQRCNWQQCNSSMECNAELVEHIRSQHVLVQKDRETFVCLWEGCKVYNRASCSLSWLERHILSHGGNRPFKCIVDNCCLRFPTQAALQRHVNSHFESSQGVKPSKFRDDAFPKSFKRKKHLKYKKRSASGHTEDFFDVNIMEQIRYKLVESHSCTNVLSNSRQITFHSRVKARRIEKTGKTKVLLEWMPQNIIPDCWVSQDAVTEYKTVPVSSLPHESLACLGLHPSDMPWVKQHRK